MSSKFDKEIKRVPLALLIAGVTVLLTACGSGGTKVTNLNVSDFGSKIKDPSVVILDVRTPAEFQEGHIQSAINIDFEASNFESEVNKLDKSNSYAVYCRSGRRSGLATEIMVKSGFKSVFNLTGGIIDWQSSGNKLVNNQFKQNSLNR